MSNKTIGIGLIIIGILVLAGSIAVDILGLGADPGTIGTKQMIGAGVGFIIVVVGVIFVLLRKKS